MLFFSFCFFVLNMEQRFLVCVKEINRVHGGNCKSLIKSNRCVPIWTFVPQIIMRNFPFISVLGAFKFAISFFAFLIYFKLFRADMKVSQHQLKFQSQLAFAHWNLADLLFSCTLICTLSIHKIINIEYKWIGSNCFCFDCSTPLHIIWYSLVYPN